jgi:hypothetical protein
MLSVGNRRVLQVFTWFFLATLCSISAASAVEIPNLSWERGREQSITLGGDTASQLWSISLIGPEGKDLIFSKSSPNQSGFLVYHAFIPLDYPVGTYDVKVKSPSEENVVAHVRIELAQNYDPLSDPKAVGGLAVLAFSLLSAFASSNRADGSTSSEKSETLDSLEGEYHSIKIARRGWFDRIGFGKSKLIFFLDEYRHIITFELSPKSSLLQRIFADGSYIQALLGPIGALTPLAGIVLGIFCGVHSDSATNVVPVGAGFFLAILLLGLFDSMAGLFAAISYGLYLLVHGDFTSALQVRGFLGLVVLWCGPILAANKLRPLRRVASENYRWERAGDFLIPALFVGFSVKGMVLALNGFTHVHNQITTHANQFAIIAGGLILLRYLVEECAIRATPARLEYLSPPVTPEIQRHFKVVALVNKTILYLFFMFGFLGWSWQLGVSIALLVFPAALKLLFPNLPNSSQLFQILPSGIPGIIFTNLLGLLTIMWVNSLPIFAADKTQIIFVLAALPGFLIGILRLFARSPKAGDRRWYMRDKNKVLYRVFGPIFITIAALMTLGVLP